MNKPSATMTEVTCPLCGGDEWRVYVWAPSHYGPEKLRVTRCRECGMIFTNPQPTSYEHDVETRGTLQRHFEPGRLQNGRQNARFQLAILSDVSPGRRLLDFGAGAGALVDEAIKQGWDATGLDLNRGLVEAANRHWGFDAMESRSLAEFVETKPLPLDAIVSTKCSNISFTLWRQDDC